MTVDAQNNSEQRSPKVESTIDQLCALNDILANVPKNAHPLIKKFWNTEFDLKNRVEELKKEKQELNDQVVALQNENSKLREEKSLVSGTNNTLRCELKAFYNWR